MNTLKIDLLKIVVDKLLIGGLIVLIGIWSTTLIEKYKAKEAYFNELSKERIARMGEVWEQAYLLDYRMREFERDWIKLLSEQQKDAQELVKAIVPKITKAPIGTTYEEIEGWSKQYSQKFDLLKETHLDEFNMILHKNRFWLDDESFLVLQDYVTTAYSFDIFLTLPREKWQQEVLQRREKLELLRKNITSVRHRVLLDGD